MCPATFGREVVGHLASCNVLSTRLTRSMPLASAALISAMVISRSIKSGEGSTSSATQA
jgi:hypothetical protein